MHWFADPGKMPGMMLCCCDFSDDTNDQTPF